MYRLAQTRTRDEIASKLGVSYDTVRRWCVEMDITNGKQGYDGKRVTPKADWDAWSQSDVGSVSLKLSDAEGINGFWLVQGAGHE
jgi:hypothetical protein